MPAQPKTKKKENQYIYANGKRKCSIARVKLFPNGKGDVTVNDTPLKDWSQVNTQIDCINSPFELTGLVKKFDIDAKVIGGGFNSQAEAIRHGISKALLEHDELLRVTLKKAGFITRDSRVKERKKYGLKKARKAPQFSKR